MFRPSPVLSLEARAQTSTRRLRRVELYRALLGEGDVIRISLRLFQGFLRGCMAFSDETRNEASNSSGEFH